MLGKGFTLIELLIVIAILAILATVVILVLNPAQMLAQARDSQRISDLQAINTALGLYVATASNPTFNTSSTLGTETASATCPFTSCGIISTSTAVDGTGWVEINFASTTGGSPLAKLPLDPSNGATYFYGFKADSTNKVWELDAKMESKRYSNGGSDDKESTDGGNNPNEYELGTSPGLAL